MVSRITVKEYFGNALIEFLHQHKNLPGRWNIHIFIHLLAVPFLHKSSQNECQEHL